MSLSRATFASRKKRFTECLVRVWDDVRRLWVTHFGAPLPRLEGMLGLILLRFAQACQCLVNRRYRTNGIGPKSALRCVSDFGLCFFFTDNTDNIGDLGRPLCQHFFRVLGSQSKNLRRREWRSIAATFTGRNARGKTSLESSVPSGGIEGPDPAPSDPFPLPRFYTRLTRPNNDFGGVDRGDYRSE
jgi:hypothetical protein